MCTETPRENKDEILQSFEDQAGLISSWMLSYLDPLLKLGASRTLTNDDIGAPSETDRADFVHTKALEFWKNECDRVNEENKLFEEKFNQKLAKISSEEKRAQMQKQGFVRKEPSLFTALTKSFGVGKLWYAMLLRVISSLLMFAPVILLNDLVKFFEQGGDPAIYQGFAHPWIEVVGLFVFPLLVTLLESRHQVIMYHCATYTRTAVSLLLYEKTLTVSASGRASTSTGQVVNMMSNDTTQLQRFLTFIGFIIVAPMQIIIALVLIYQQVGNATWVGVAFMVGLIPINIFIFKFVGNYRRLVLKHSDARVKMMNEIFTGIRIIKFYAWETAFRKEVGKIRNEEMRALTKLAYISAVGFSLILLSAPIIQPILVFLTYISIQKYGLTAATAFTTVALFNIMRFPFAFLPMGLLQYIQAKIALRRLGNYLHLPELRTYVLDSNPPSDFDETLIMTDTTKEEGSITMKNCTFSWVDPEAVEEIKRRSSSSKKPKKKSKRGKNERRSSSDTTSTNNSIKEEHMKRVNSIQSLASMADSEGGTEQTSTSPHTLRNISCHIPAGSLVAVVGAVGCGKSTFLSAILGEVEPVDDTSKVYIPRSENRKGSPGFVSYCAQTPWILNSTLKENILFGRSFDEERYNEVVHACALSSDLEILPAGDMTEIGERGINLSGGQKARVALARAMYSSNTKVLLLDDPLSAVDAHVGEHIFSEAIASDLVENSTRILVTHHVHFLPRCDYVLVLKEGEVQHMGKYEELIEQGVDFHGAVDFKEEDADKSEETEEDKKNEDSEEADKEAPVKKNEDSSSSKEENQTELSKKGQKLVTTEEKAEGQVAGSAYIHYAKAGGLCRAVMMFVIQAAGRGFEISSAFWLAHWAANANSGERDTMYYLNIYALFGLGGVLGLTGRAIVLAWHRLRASLRLHDDLTVSILRAPVSFYDVTPTGRILNRFAADMDKIDLELSNSLSQGINTMFSVFGAVGAIIAATKGAFLIPFIPLSYFYYYVQKWFRRSSTELQRITSVNNSPIFSDFSQTLSGTSTIRAYGSQNRFFEHCMTSFDSYNASYMLTQLTNAWLGLRLDVLGSIIGFFTGGLSVATAPYNFIPAGWLGLALSYSIEVTSFLKHGVKMIATIEAEMNSVERVLFYTNNVTPEAPDNIPEKDPEPNTWPHKGDIQIQNASMRYRDGPLVLKNISVSIKGGEKIGVVGRTGSGKSSLMIALFRISELESDGGKITIDGIDISDVGTDALRMGLSIIPQDPIMFSNTVRYNIDPFNTASESDLWTVLEKVRLDTVVAMLPQGLDEMVTEGGENFSQGQRQLLCIARSLLRKPKVLIMDEATASIDNETDAQIQKMIRENFKEATVLTIAHRLNTIMDSDRVLVLDDGHVMEFDAPKELLKKENGLFRGMVDKSRSVKK